jgi:Fe2+ transport system protein B
LLEKDADIMGKVDAISDGKNLLVLVEEIVSECLATIAACKKEFGWKKSLGMAVFDVALALLVGGLAFRVLNLLI